MPIATSMFALGLLGILPAAAETAPSQKIKLAILDVNPQGSASKDLAATLNVLLAKEVTALGAFEIITQQDVRRMVSFDQMKTAYDCSDDASCLAEIGDALGVPYLLTATVTQLGPDTVLALTLIDIDNVKTVTRETERAKDVPGLIDGLPRLVHRTLEALLEKNRGTLTVLSSVDGAVVEVDGRAVGVTPLRPLPMAAGPHRVSVVHEGYVTFTQDVDVPPDNLKQVVARLQPLPATYRALWWSAFGWQAAAVATGALGAAGVIGGIAAVGFGEYWKFTAGKPLGAFWLLSEQDAAIVTGARAAGTAAAFAGAVVFVVGAVWALLVEYPEPFLTGSAEERE